jgi:hypothetical protein
MIAKRAHTLVEMMVVLAVFIFIFGAVISIMLASNSSWRTGQHIIYEQQEARKAMDSITRLLRQSNPNWGVVPGENRILFYRPVFDVNGNLVDKHWVVFKLNPLDPRQLIKSEQGLATAVIAQDMDGLDFTCLMADCSVVKVEVKTRIDALFTLTSKVLLRNTNPALAYDPQIISPPEGEF